MFHEVSKKMNSEFPVATWWDIHQMWHQIQTRLNFQPFRQKEPNHETWLGIGEWSIRKPFWPWDSLKADQGGVKFLEGFLCKMLLWLCKEITLQWWGQRGGTSWWVAFIKTFTKPRTQWKLLWQIREYLLDCVNYCFCNIATEAMNMIFSAQWITKIYKRENVSLFLCIRKWSISRSFWFEIHQSH